MKKLKKLAGITLAASVGFGGFTTYVSAEEMDKSVTPMYSKFSNVKISYKNESALEVDVNKALQKARAATEKVKKDEVKKIKEDNIDHVVNYTLIDGEQTYFYEESSLNGESITVYPTKTEKNNTILPSTTSNDLILPAIKGGIGGKAVIPGGGSYLNTTVRTGTIQQTEAKNESLAYIYTGFSGISPNNKSIEADMGLQYSNDSKIWKPAFLYYYEGVQYKINTYKNNDDRVSYQNGFIPGTDVNMTIYPNANGNAQLTVSGYAKYSDKGGNGTNTYLTSILEAVGKPAKRVDNWKTLVTIANKNATSAEGKAYGKFKNINVNGNSVYPKLDSKDNATTVDILGNNVEISISK
ncbi:YrpD family protein [Bacillus paranthracis]|uniref:YrpD family protein n=1 Tax=Bacillus paranthracis TaxID=2026186 RepID=UPI003D1C6906